MSEPEWMQLLRTRLTERNTKEGAFTPIIEQYRRLAQQTKLLKERNASLLRAVGSVKHNPSSSTVYVPGTAEDNPVRAAYMASLESQISSLRDELATVYKTQGQNAQRLLSMNETLREKEEQSRVESENSRVFRDELTVLRRKVDQHSELMQEKDRTAQILHDEISTLQLELGQIEERNTTLTKDNAKLLQRWLDAKQAEATKLNEANAFYEDMRTKHADVLKWRGEGSEPGPGAGADTESNTSGNLNGLGSGDHASPRMDGIPSSSKDPSGQTPNG